MVSEREPTRSMTRPKRCDMERIKAPHTESSSAGVIMDVKTAAVAEGEWMRLSGRKSTGTVF